MRIKNKTLSIIFKAIIALCGLVGVELSAQFFTANANFDMLHFYTNLSNIFVSIYYICAVVWLIKNFKDDKKITFCPAYKGMTVMAITLTMLVVVFILRMGFTMNNTMGISLFLLHYLVPILTIIDWILFDEKGSFKKSFPLIWTAPPILYVTYAMIAARIGDGIGYGTSRYPYPFLDVDALGVPMVAVMIVVISACYIGLGFVYFAIDKKLGKKKHSDCIEKETVSK